MEPNNDALVKTLSASIRSAILLPSAGSLEPITEVLATFAVRRHRVGPLLHLACQGSEDIFAEEAALSILQSSYRQNCLRNLHQQAVKKRLSDLLLSHSVPFSFLKGDGLAEQLYDDPTVRLSKDVDVLIPSDCLQLVIRIMRKNGYMYKPYTVRRKKIFEKMRQNMDAKIFKDLAFIDPIFQVPIELHVRLFQIEPNNLTNDFNEAIKLTKNPSIYNGFYCLYLILHGANARWQRLKWVIDLSILARKMRLQSRLEMMSIAKSYNCEIAVAASLLMTEAIFPGSLDDDWQMLLGSYRQDKRVHHIKELFYQTLKARDLAIPRRSVREFILPDNVDFIFPGKISLLERFFVRSIASLSIRI